MKTWGHFSIVGILAIFCILFAGCPGIGGPEGIQGEKGETGEKGKTGEKGEKGDKGEKGIDGINSYLVIFDSNGGIPYIGVAAVTHGEKVTKPDIIPIKNSTGLGAFIGWYQDKNLTVAFNFDASITANITLYAKYDLLLQIGDTGPGGGKIFYRSESGFIMTDTNEICHYLEVSPVDVGTNLQWSSASFISSGFGGTAGWWVSIEGTADGIGTGRKNTAIILGIDANAPAAKVCNDYSNNGKSDWFLPSIEELFQLRINRDSIDSHWEVAHWSSTLYNNSNRFTNGAIRTLQIDYDYTWLGYGKTDVPVTIANAANAYFVRAIRAF